MARETIPTDITATPEVARLAREVAVSGRRRTLTENGAALAVVSPALPRRRHTARPRPLTRDNPIWEVVGSITDDLGADVSSNKHTYLAEAYASESP